MDVSNTDCYFFYFSTCTKGTDCPFRHCAAAIGSKDVCKVWLKRRDCTKKNCPRRHMDTKRNRGSTPCYYENKDGCMKPHCAYLHRKPRLYLQEAIERKDSSVIMPLGNLINKRSSSESAEPCTRNGGKIISSISSSVTSGQEYDASSESSEELESDTDPVDKTLIKHLVQETEVLNLQGNNRENKRRSRNQPTTGGHNSRDELNLLPRSGRKKMEVGARSASCHNTRIRTPKFQPVDSLLQHREESGARRNLQNGNQERSNALPKDVLWQFDSSKLPRKPRKKEEKYELALDFGLGTKQKIKYSQPGRRE